MSSVLELASGATGRAAPPSAPPRPADALRLSVVVPTCRRPLLLRRCLEALIAQSFPAHAYEIVVVDDGRTPEAQALVNDMARLHPDHSIRYTRPQGSQGPAAARNAGWRAARAPIVAFTDDDTVPDPAWLAHGERALEEGLAAVSGQVVVPPSSTGQGGRGEAAPTDHELMTRGLERAEFVTANAFVRRSALIEIGGFDDRFRRAWREDSDLHFRLLEEGMRLGRCAEAVVLHPVRPEPWGVSLRQQKNVFYDALLFKKHPRLYRQRILAAPPLDYYLIVGLSIAAVALMVLDVPGSAMVSAALAALLVGGFALRRLRHTSRRPGHVIEMVVTSALIPFLSVYWRLRGAVHFRVRYL